MVTEELNGGWPTIDSSRPSSDRWLAPDDTATPQVHHYNGSGDGHNGSRPFGHSATADRPWPICNAIHVCGGWLAGALSLVSTPRFHCHPLSKLKLHHFTAAHMNINMTAKTREKPRWSERSQAHCPLALARIGSTTTTRAPQ